MTREPRVALTMIVRDGADKLARCLHSVRDAVDDVVVVDTGSADATRDIAARLGARVYSYTWADHFAEARNYALARSTADWNLVLDHDEWLPEDGAAAVRSAVMAAPAIGAVMVLDAFEQDGQRKLAHSYVSRLLPQGVAYRGRIHEQPASDLPRRDTSIVVHHDGYFQADKSERNLPLLRRALAEDGDDPYLYFQIGRQYRTAKQYAQAGAYYRQGYTILTRRERFAPNLIVDYIYNCIDLGDYATAFEIVRAERQYLADFPDFHFVRGALYTHCPPPGADPFQLIHEAYITCLELGETGRYHGVVGTGSFQAAHNLGALYEILGDAQAARSYYERAAAAGFQPSIERLEASRR